MLAQGQTPPPKKNKNKKTKKNKTHLVTWGSVFILNSPSEEMDSETESDLFKVKTQLE